MRIPKNQIVINKSENNNLSYDSSGIKHSGPSYQVNGVSYSGEYNNNLSPLTSKLIPEKNNVKSSVINKFGYGTEQYKRAINNNYFAASLLNSPKGKIKDNIKSLNGVRYYSKNINSNIIKGLNFDEYNSLIKSNNPIFKIVKLNFNSPTVENELDIAEKIIPGLRGFLGL